MKYVGIDLGTTNSAIALFDGADLTLFKSPEQHDVTPSAIYVDRRGNRYVGARAYGNASLDPENAAVLFKRQMGTSTKFNIPNLGHSLTAEACSAELLKVLYGYLPDAIRNADETGTVITVPAAFDQMQKDATLAAAEQAGIGRVALMQEPVAAVMSVMRRRRTDGIFLIYDLGGGTLDIAVAQSISGRVNLLAHGGIAMCGGRDFDRAIVDNVVQPWLHSHFDLGDDAASTEHRRLSRLVTWASERAKIELSQRESTTIALSESELGRRDAKGQEVYVDAPIDRATLDHLIADQVRASIDAARQTLEKAGLDAADVERIVFVGGPTYYGPLRERVAFELGIAASTEVNPMTAVAEGAAIFAESIDWSNASRGRKDGRGQLASEPLSLTFHYVSRTPSDTARVSLELTKDATPGAEFQIDSLDTGWSSGRLPLRRGASTDLPLSRAGENCFRALLFDAAGGPIPIPEDRIFITRTAATIDGIPASRSIGIEVRERIGGAPAIDFLVREGEALPKKGTRTYKAEVALNPGEPKALNFRIWEGDIADPISDNTYVGTFNIRGNDLSDRPIPAGAELICDFEILDSGNIVLHVRVPAVAGSFNSGRNFYSRQEGLIDYGSAEDLLLGDAAAVSQRLDRLAGRVPDEDLEPARRRVVQAQERATADDPERAKQAAGDIQAAKQLISEIRVRHLRPIREFEFERMSALFNDGLRSLARPSEVEAFDAAARSAEAAISSPDMRFEDLLETMRGRAYSVLWRQDDFIVNRFNYLAASPHFFRDTAAFHYLVGRGNEAHERQDFDGLRRLLAELEDIRIAQVDDIDMSLSANIVKAR